MELSQLQNYLKISTKTAKTFTFQNHVPKQHKHDFDSLTSLTAIMDDATIRPSSGVFACLAREEHVLWWFLFMEVFRSFPHVRARFRGDEVRGFSVENDEGFPVSDDMGATQSETCFFYGIIVRLVY